MQPFSLQRLEEARLGEAGGGPLALGSRDDNRAAVLALAGQARRRIDIFTQDLEPALYDCGEFIEVLTRLVLGSRQARVRILAVDLSRAVREGHRLIEFCRRLSSYAAIQRCHEDDRERSDAFLLADDHGLLHRRLASRPEGLVDFDAPAEVRRLRSEFETLWARSAPEPDLRRLHL
ncbi:hypothetical protein QVG61_07715 [Thiohalobacter sp. IOR34]|uniref:DUF7931 domain-containing protein n=1 Tax=Thiohalobacter sp. IOR34 TaxID=3057176 RepID=UPI0025B241EB|nr:hypothetical protein [Thiohalobacter sp. IOR34]WJW74404.1 hypothetical protein QVG61_07715 [Thiohalobacter sp. IOR34]